MVPLFAALLSLVVSTPGSMAARQGGAEPLWQVPIERRVEHVFLTDDGTLLGVGEEGLLAFDPDSGAVRWLFPRGEANGIEVFETGEDGVIAIVTRLGQSAIAPAGPAYAIMLIETATGRAHWRTAPAPGAVVGFEGAADRDRLLLLVSGAVGEATLFALSHATGRVVWQAGLGPMPTAGETGTPDRSALFQLMGERVFSANRAETPVAISARELGSGDLDWVAYLFEDGGDPLLGAHGDLLLVTGEHLHALDPATGAESWRVDGPWLGLQEQEPWLLLRDRDSERLLVVHAVSGEARWRRAAPVDPSPVTAVAWPPEGVLVGEPGGETVSYDPVNGRRAGRINARYRVNEDRELEWAFPVREGMLFVAALEGGTRIIATGGAGGTAWELELDRLPTVGSGRPGPSEHLLLPPIPAGMGSAPGREDLWLVVRTAEAPTLVRIGLRTGTVQTIAPVAATSTTFAVDGARRRVYYVDPSRNLVGASW